MTPRAFLGPPSRMSTNWTEISSLPLDIRAANPHTNNTYLPPGPSFSCLRPAALPPGCVRRPRVDPETADPACLSLAMKTPQPHGHGWTRAWTALLALAVLV